MEDMEKALYTNLGGIHSNFGFRMIEFERIHIFSKFELERIWTDLIEFKQKQS